MKKYPTINPQSRSTAPTARSMKHFVLWFAGILSLSVFLSLYGVMTLVSSLTPRKSLETKGQQDVEVAPLKSYPTQSQKTHQQASVTRHFRRVKIADKSQVGMWQQSGVKNTLPSRKATPTQTLSVVSVAWEGTRWEAVAGEWLISARTSSGTADLTEYVQRWGGQVRHTLWGVQHIRFPSHQAGVSAMQTLRRKGWKGSIRPHVVCRGVREDRKELRTLPASLPASAFWFHQAADFTFSKSSSTGGKGVTVALLDTGVAYKEDAHASKSSDGKTQWVRYKRAPYLEHTNILTGKNFINPELPPLDDNQHGTFLATLITGQYGIAPGIKLLPVKVLDANRIGTELSVAQGIHYAVQQGADILNMSLVFPAGYFPGKLLTQAMHEAIRKGVVVIAASGNGGNSSTPQVRYPAAFAPVLAVGAGHLAQQKGSMDVAPYSSYGGALDLVAPGGRLDQDVNKDNIPDGVVSQTFAPGNPTQFGHWLMSGTSIATAYATGAAALLLARGVSSQDLTARLTQSAGPIGKMAGFHPRVGWGGLKIHRAMKRNTPTHNTPRCYVNLMPVVSHKSQQRYGWMNVEVLDENKQPMNNVQVYARWLGQEPALAEAQTQRDGIARFRSTARSGRVGLFGFALDTIIRGQRRRCELQMFTRVTQGTLAQLQQQEGDGAWLIRLDQSYLVLAYPELSSEAQPTAMLIPSGTGLLSSVRVFGEDLYFQEFEQDSLDLMTWDSMWSLGVGSQAYPLDGGGGGSSVWWQPQASQDGQPLFWGALSPLAQAASSQSQATPSQPTASHVYAKPLP